MGGIIHEWLDDLSIWEYEIDLEELSVMVVGILDLQLTVGVFLKKSTLCSFKVTTQYSIISLLGLIDAYSLFFPPPSLSIKLARSETTRRGKFSFG